MDKLYSSAEKNKELSETEIEKNGVFSLLLSLALICSSFFVFNLSIRLNGEERAGGVIKEAILAASEKLEENEAIAVFLGLDDYPAGYDEKEIY